MRWVIKLHRRAAEDGDLSDWPEVIPLESKEAGIRWMEDRGFEVEEDFEGDFIGIQRIGGAVAVLEWECSDLDRQTRTR